MAPAFGNSQSRTLSQRQNAADFHFSSNQKFIIVHITPTSIASMLHSLFNFVLKWPALIASA
jgi:hypothetical protein